MGKSDCNVRITGHPATKLTEFVSNADDPPPLTVTRSVSVAPLPVVSPCSVVFDGVVSVPPLPSVMVAPRGDGKAEELKSNRDRNRRKTFVEPHPSR